MRNPLRSIRLPWNQEGVSRRSFPWFVVLLVLTLGAYYTFVQFLIHRLPVRMDEFVAARQGLNILAGNSGRSVFIGHYLEGALVSFGDTAWSRMMIGRGLFAAINTIALALGVIALRRPYPVAVVFVLPLLLLLGDFALGMVESRIELLIGWMGVGVLLALRRDKPVIAGVLAAGAVVLGRPGILQFLAALLTLGTGAFLEKEQREGWKRFGFYLLAAVGVFAAHATFFLLLGAEGADFVTMFRGLVGTVTPLGGTKLLGHYFWMESVWNDCAFWVLTLAALWSFDTARRRDGADRESSVVASYVFFLFVWVLLRADAQPPTILNVLPVAFAVQVLFVRRSLEGTDPTFRGGFTWPALGFLAVFGLIFPLRGTLNRVEEFDIGRQRESVEVADWLLRDGGTYFSGVPVLINRTPAVERYADLIGALRNELARLSKPRQQALIDDFRAAGLKVLILSYRTSKLPKLVDAYFKNQFAPVNGNVHVYSPEIPAEAKTFELAFEGYYELGAAGPVTIDGSIFGPGDRVYLTAGTHEFNLEDSTEGPFRLHYAPPGLADRLDRAYAKEGPLFRGLVL